MERGRIVTTSPPVAVPAPPIAAPVAAVPRRRDDRRAAWLFLLPALVGFAAFYLYPTIRGAWYSVTDYSLLNTPSYVGADNYRQLATDRVFWESMRATAYYV